MRKLITFSSPGQTVAWCIDRFGREHMIAATDRTSRQAIGRLADRRTTGDLRAHWQCMLQHAEAIAGWFESMPQGGVMGSGLGSQRERGGGSLVRHQDIRANDVANEGVAMSSGGANPHGWTLGIAVMGVFRESNTVEHHHAANDFVPDEHHWDIAVFPDQFGRPKDADGHVIELAPFSTFRYVEPGEDGEFGYWVTDIPGNYTPQPRSGLGGWGVHLDEDDMYAMTNQRKSLNDDVADAEEEEVTDE